MLLLKLVESGVLDKYCSADVVGCGELGTGSIVLLLQVVISSGLDY
jgi:hypothetical protein